MKWITDTNKTLNAETNNIKTCIKKPLFLCHLIARVRYIEEIIAKLPRIIMGRNIGMRNQNFGLSRRLNVLQHPNRMIVITFSNLIAKVKIAEAMKMLSKTARAVRSL